MISTNKLIEGLEELSKIPDPNNEFNNVSEFMRLVSQRLAEQEFTIITLIKKYNLSSEELIKIIDEEILVQKGMENFRNLYNKGANN